MNPTWQRDGVQLYLSDCLDILRQMPDNSIDALVTDPPAGIGFMGKEWDHDKGGRDAWVAWLSGVMSECLRVLKPGAHALVWALPRTSHWTGWALEEAGFEIRDRIAHLFGSGFPKSLDVSKAIDKHGGKAVSWFGQWLRHWRETNGIAQKEIAALFPSKTGGLTGCVANWELGFNMPTADQFNTICRHFGLPFESIEEAEREVIGVQKNAMSGWSMDGATKFSDRDITAPATPAAVQWQGWGTALKPACEDWWLCRKPLAEGTVAANVLEWGTGAINVGQCRVEILTGQLPYDILTNKKGGISWAKEERLCDSCASAVAKRVKHGQPETGDCTAQDNVKQPTCARDIQSQPDMSRGATGCSDGTRAGNTDMSLNTAESGEKQMDQCQTAMYSTTSTETRKTTDSKTCALCGVVLTSENTKESTRQTASDLTQRHGNNGRDGHAGRWPSNVTHDGSEEVLAGFPMTNGTAEARRGWYNGRDKSRCKGAEYGHETLSTFGDSGSAARFFYCPKASRQDREEGCEGLGYAESHTTYGDYGGTPEHPTNTDNKARNHHPTVKPTPLMRWLCRLITPPGDTVLDPFMGSGSTGKAATLEGFGFIGIELDPEYYEIAVKRIEQAMMQLRLEGL